MAFTSKKPLTIDELLVNHVCGHGEVLKIEGLDEGLDVYNPAPFELDGRIHLLGRVEPHDGKISHLAFFSHNGDGSSLQYRLDLPVFEQSEDPFLKRINHRLVLGAVKVIVTKQNGEVGVEASHTSISVGDRLDEFQPLVNGPQGMKDIRLFQMTGSRVGALTRPEDKVTGSKDVGLAILGSFGEVSSRVLAEAPVIPGLRAPRQGEHRGGNEGVALDNGFIGYLGHVARIGSDMYKEYYVETAQIDPKTLETSQHKIVACPDCFPGFTPKTPQHERVVFPQGILNGYLYAGLGDAACGVLKIGNPYNPAQPLPFG
jgi:hypothetical protein